MLVRNVHLLGTQGCHLCDLAAKVLIAFNEAMREQNFRLEIADIDISVSESMVNEYGVRIPVLIDCISKQELAWPFEEQDVYQFLRRCDRVS